MSNQQNPFPQTKDEYNARSLGGGDLYQVLLQANIKALEIECLQVMTQRHLKEISRKNEHPNESINFTDDKVEVKIPHFYGVATNAVSDVVVKSLKEKGFSAYHAMGDWLVIHLTD
ncbi:MAG: hypothetical protein ACI8QY_001068 [bacterium]|jgi:hypothetical protein